MSMLTDEDITFDKSSPKPPVFYLHQMQQLFQEIGSSDAQKQIFGKLVRSILFSMQQHEQKELSDFQKKAENLLKKIHEDHAKVIHRLQMEKVHLEMNFLNDKEKASIENDLKLEEMAKKFEKLQELVSQLE